MKSLDIGTMNLCKGELDIATEEPSFTIERNCFLQAAVSDDTETTLKENNWNYVKHENNCYILGEDAIKLKNLLTVGGDQGIVMTKVGELRRPMKDGVLNTAEEKLSVAIIQKLIFNLIGKPAFPNEVLCFCVPGDPVNKNFNVVFHRTMLTNFVKSLGYTPECIPEALAIIFSTRPVMEDSSEPSGEAPFSGVAISAGSGMINICLSENTIIPLLDGRSLTIKELSNLYKSDEKFWVYSCQQNGEIVPGEAYAPRCTQKNATVYRIKLDDQSYFECTSEHKIMLRDGSYKEAKFLKKGDSLMPLYKWKGHVGSSKNEYQMIKNNKSGKWVWTHRHVLKHIIGRHVDKEEVVHHKNFNPLDNSPENLQLFANHSEHTSLHMLLREASILRLKGKTYEEIQKNPKMAAKRRKEQSRRIKEKKTWEYERTPEIRQKISNSLKGNIPWNKGMSKEEYEKHFKNGFQNQHTKKNHKVISVRKISKVRDVYDLTVNKYSNFAIQTSEKGGVFVHNCLAVKKMPLINFSVANSGDWIDIEASKVSGIDVSAMTRFKEKNLDLNNIDFSDIRQASLSIFYDSMIQNALTNFSAKFNQLDNHIEAPLEIVIAGGTALVPGFIDRFKNVLSTLSLPFKVKNVRLAENALYTVSHGCLVKAISVEKKTKEEAAKK